MSRSYLSLGSNLGNREENLTHAIRMLEDVEQIRVEKTSSIYQTEPVGYSNQPDFLNMVVRIDTELSPEQLLDETQKIESELGRVRALRFGPRTMDVDIILFENEKRKDEKLTIPHPRMWERAFVMIPLLEIFENTSNEVFECETVRLYSDIHSGSNRGKLSEKPENK
ncbi:MAG: 2-amino-4-hydroxy-6-hydroxymethyldihydropteridine diphosphokinase [Clostridiaceae bacterium]|nr:2-amino-4-hydroxy-6-hydroxymethyldihydropteridine diphosphokinase [Clostridiaceae bacterium]